METRQDPRLNGEGPDGCCSDDTSPLDDAARIRLDFCTAGTAVLEYVHRCQARAR